MNKILLHLEGLFVFIISIYLYGQLDGSWLLFILLILLPDVSVLGYLVNNKIGSYAYNIVHTYMGPIFLMLVGFFLEMPLLLTLGLIWTAHIGIDRAFGFGLKYRDSFKNTHMQKV